MKKGFRGFYIKCNGEKNIAFVFGQNANKSNKSSFIQVITKDASFNENFEFDEFTHSKKPFRVSVGETFIDSNSLNVEINRPGLQVHGKLEFSEFAKIKYDAMGPLKLLPRMECKHYVTSMSHTVTGQLVINGEIYTFNNDPGYIEGDRGKSFPLRYFWTQCNSWTESKDLSIMAAAARIPYMGIRFTGTICIVHYAGKEYRLASYLGARVKEFTNTNFVIKQGSKLLEIKVTDDQSKHSLFAPDLGNMTRIIKENIHATVNYKFTVGRGKNRQILFDITSPNAAFEFSEKPNE
ncbi:MAG: tocopherol cyclase family protein [Firmicutes bacterium]|nr:tocopherol cyclase family protein [Bacillota bacterium]